MSVRLEYYRFSFVLLHRPRILVHSSGVVRGYYGGPLLHSCVMLAEAGMVSDFRRRFVIFLLPSQEA